MKRKFERNPYRELPDGTITRFYPFHISLEGLESLILCRSDKDYDAIVKIICLCARRKNVFLVIYAVVSNHLHCVILADSQSKADTFVLDVKKIISMYCHKELIGKAALKRTDATAIYLDSDSYLRNAIAYVIRNAMDNGARSIQEYKWSGYRAAFCHGRTPAYRKVRAVRDLSKSERREIMHTGDKLDDVGWMINESGELEPVSICDWQYIEEAFLHDQSYYLRLIGGVNIAQMNTSLIESPRTKRTDGELLASVNEISQRWFSKDVRQLTIEVKARMMNYICHSFCTTPSQLARVFELRLDTVQKILGKKRM